MESIFQKNHLVPFEVKNFSWETDKLNFKNFCRIKKFQQILKKSRVQALKSDGNSGRYLKNCSCRDFPSKMAKSGGANKFSPIFKDIERT